MLSAEDERGRGCCLPKFLSPMSQCQHGAAACDAQEQNRLRDSLQIIALVDMSLLLLPIGLLAALTPSITNASDGRGGGFLDGTRNYCGWTPQLLRAECSIALLAFWLSIVTGAAHSVALRSSCNRKVKCGFLRCPDVRLTIPVLGTCLGGGMCVRVLDGHLALSSFGSSCDGSIALGSFNFSLSQTAAAVISAYSFVAFMSALIPRGKLLCSDGCTCGCQGSPVAEGSDAKAYLPGLLPKCPSSIKTLHKQSAGANDECNFRHATEEVLVPIVPEVRHDGRSSIVSAVLDPMHEHSETGSAPIIAATHCRGKSEARSMCRVSIDSEEEATGTLAEVMSSVTSEAFGSNIADADYVSERLWFSETSERSVMSKLCSAAVDKKTQLGAGAAASEGHPSFTRSASEPSAKRTSALKPPRCPLSTVVPTTPQDNGDDQSCNGGAMFASSFAQRRVSLIQMESSRVPSKSNKRVSRVSFLDPDDHKRNARGIGFAPKRGSALPGDQVNSCAALKEELSGESTPASGSGTLEGGRVLHMKENPINFGNLKHDNPSDSDNDGSKESGGFQSDSEDEGEIWVSPNPAKVEVPIWLLERLKAEGWEPPEQDAAEEDTTSEKKSAVSRPGTPTEDSKRRLSHMVMPSTAFWKIPMPTRKNSAADSKPSKPTVATEFHDVSCDESKDTFEANTVPSPYQVNVVTPHDDARNSAKRSITFVGVNKSSDRRKSILSDQSDTTEDGSTKNCDPTEEGSDVKINYLGAAKRSNVAPHSGHAGPSGVRGRQSSVLGLFSDDNAKAPGLYMLPKEDNQTSEVVEVRRDSLSMSASMLTEILRGKMNDSDRLEQIMEDGKEGPTEIVLPFFAPMQKHIKECQCSVDPVTGYIFHTCMTPATTHATNTETMVSYVCSAWGSRRNSIGHSRASRSRRDSASTEDDFSGNEDSVGALVPPPPPPPIGDHPRKRIRNASMLAMVGAAGPKPRTITGRGDEDPPPENELRISFRSIQQSVAPQDGSGSADTPEAPPGPAPTLTMASGGDAAEEALALGQAMEERVENELGMRFELLEPLRLASMLQDPETREQLLTVDVRGRDWVGGHIPSSVNLRTSEVVGHPYALLLQCRTNRIQHVVFTCMYSVLRARKCALATERAQEEDRRSTASPPPRIRISLLAGGMHAWVNQFAKDNMLLDCFDPEMWSDGGPSQGGLVHVMDALWTSGGQKALSDALSQELEQLSQHRRASDSGCASASPSGSVSQAGTGTASSRRTSTFPAAGIEEAAVEQPQQDAVLEQKASLPSPDVPIVDIDEPPSNAQDDTGAEAFLAASALLKPRSCTPDIMLEDVVQHVHTD